MNDCLSGKKRTRYDCSKRGIIFLDVFLLLKSTAPTTVAGGTPTDRKGPLLSRPARGTAMQLIKGNLLILGVAILVVVLLALTGCAAPAG